MRVIYRLDTIKERLRPIFDSYPVNQATLFGSYARGDMTPESDLDMVIDCDDEMKNIKFYAMWADVEEDLKKSVDMIANTELIKNTEIYDSVKKEGVVIYEKNG